MDDYEAMAEKGATTAGRVNQIKFLKRCQIILSGILQINKAWLPVPLSDPDLRAQPNSSDVETMR